MVALHKAQEPVAAEVVRHVKVLHGVSTGVSPPVPRRAYRAQRERPSEHTRPPGRKGRPGRACRGQLQAICCPAAWRCCAGGPCHERCTRSTALPLYCWRLLFPLGPFHSGKARGKQQLCPLVVSYCGSPTRRRMEYISNAAVEGGLPGILGSTIRAGEGMQVWGICAGDGGRQMK
jgi:hypothetical protein